MVGTKAARHGTGQLQWQSAVSVVFHIFPFYCPRADSDPYNYHNIPLSLSARHRPGVTFESRTHVKSRDRLFHEILEIFLRGSEQKFSPILVGQDSDNRPRIFIFGKQERILRFCEFNARFKIGSMILSSTYFFLQHCNWKLVACFNTVFFIVSSSKNRVKLNY